MTSRDNMKYCFTDKAKRRWRRKWCWSRGKEEQGKEGKGREWSLSFEHEKKEASLVILMKRKDGRERFYAWVTPACHHNPNNIAVDSRKTRGTGAPGGRKRRKRRRHSVVFYNRPQRGNALTGGRKAETFMGYKKEKKNNGVEYRLCGYCL